jgi:hypothetical protein
MELYLNLIPFELDEIIISHLRAKARPNPEDPHADPFGRQSISSNKSN